MSVSDPNQEKTDRQRELRIQRQLGFVAGLFQEDVTVRTLLESLAEGVIIIDQSGTILLVNARAEQMFGYPKQELIGKPHSMLIPEGSRKTHEDHQAQFFQAPKIRPMGELLDLYGLRRDGSEFPLEISLSFVDTITGVLVLALISDISLRKQMEQTLQKSEDLFHLQLECVKGYAIYTLDTEGKVLNWNVGAEHLREYRAEEIIGKPSDCFYTEEDREAGKPADNLKRAEAEGRFEEEGWRLRMDGSRFWAEAIITALCDEKGNLCGFSNVTRDITERKLVEDELKLQQRLMVNAERLANVGSWEWDIEENLWTFSDNWLHISGVGRRTMSVEELLPIAHPDDRTKVQLAFEDALRNGKPYDIQHRVIRQDTGEVRYVQAFGESTTDEMGHRRLIGVVQDITERKHAEEALRESEERFRLMANAAPVMIWEAGPDARCKFFNTSWLEFTGRSLEQELGDGWTQGVHPDDLERCVDVYRSAVKDRCGFSMEYRLRRADGRHGWIFDTGAPRLAPNGDLLGYIGSCFDITERKQAKEELQQANELLTQRVAERTAELSDTIASLKDEIDQRIRMGQALQEEITERLNAQVMLREKGTAAITAKPAGSHGRDDRQHRAPVAAATKYAWSARAGPGDDLQEGRVQHGISGGQCQKSAGNDTPHVQDHR